MKNKKIIGILLGVGFILFTLLLLKQFTNFLNWDLFDFILVGIMLFGVGFCYELITEKTSSKTYKAGTIIAVVATFILILANLAVGIIGSENNPLNLMYFSIPVIEIIGAIISRFKSKGMKYTLYITAVAQLLIFIAAFIIGKPEITLDLLKILGINMFFAMIFIVSALLFKLAAKTESEEVSKTIL